MSLDIYRAKVKMFSETMLCYFGNQILKGLQYIHSQSVAHMDIKEGNLIINEKLEIKIIDFGLSFKARDRGKDKPLHGGETTFHYMSPELHYRTP